MFLFGASILGSFLIITRGWWYICHRYRILDKPGPDVPARDRVPTIQAVGIILCLGIGIYLAYIYSYISQIWHPALKGLYIGGGLRFLISLCDEMGRIVHKRFRVSTLVRFTAQILAGGLAWYMSGVGIFALPLPGLEDIILPSLLSLLVTIARFVLYMNAINRFDGVYALASGVSTLGFMSLASILLLVIFPSYALINPLQIEHLQISLLLSIFCFIIGLIYTCMEYKPTGLVRDVGTSLFGFLLAYLSLLGGAKIGSMIVVLALPLFDAIRVILDRCRQGKNPMKGDYTHLHYRLMTLGRNRHEVRRGIRIYTLVMMVLMLLQGTDKIGKIIIFIMMFLLFFGTNAYIYWYKKLPSVYRPGVQKDNNDG